MVKGLTKFWICDIQRSRDKLAGVKAILLNKNHEIDILTKEKMIDDIDTVFRLLRKGRSE